MNNPFIPLYDAITDTLDRLAWWRYYYSHALIALAIQGVTVALVGWHTGASWASAWGASLAIAVYLSRKICEYQKKTDPTNRWDWPGLTWPTAAALLALLVGWLVLVALLIAALLDALLPAAMPGSRYWRRTT